ncbi:MAG: hypothetical protein F6J97_20560 [Leptolyngbya sp. SIO4C1]|nr:hypothetical protein [Leptolyngbya sp. SIO4C1]
MTSSTALAMPLVISEFNPRHQGEPPEGEVTVPSSGHPSHPPLEEQTTGTSSNPIGDSQRPAADQPEDVPTVPAASDSEQAVR